MLLYGTETWLVCHEEHFPEITNLYQQLPSLLKIKQPKKINNRDLWEQTNQEPIAQRICRRKWRWIEHTLRKSSSDITRQTIARVGPEWEAVRWSSEGDMEEVM